MVLVQVSVYTHVPPEHPMNPYCFDGSPIIKMQQFPLDN